MSRLLRAVRDCCIAMLIAAASTAAAMDGAGGDSPRPALLDVSVNGERSPQPVLFLQGAGGTLYANRAAFRAWRLRLPAVAPVMFEGEPYYPLRALTTLDVRLSEADQSVTIRAPASAFEARVESLDPNVSAPMNLPATGAFLTYDLVGEHVGGRTSVAGAFDLAVFTPHGVGQTSLLASAGDGKARVVRLESGWSVDRPANATSVRIGDSVSSGGSGGTPVRFAGIHYYRNYAIQPVFITFPLPSGSGEAAVPSIVDVYVNNALQSSLRVAPGPFELTNIPVQTGGGTVQIVVRDLLGREVISEQDYYASNRLLRPGLHEFSYEAGFVRRDFGRRSNAYGDFMASTTHRLGLSDRVTIEAHAEASESVRMASGAITMLDFDLGQLGASVAVSHSGQGAGYRIGAAFERRSRRYSFGIKGEYASRRYRFIGSPERGLPRYTLQAYGDLPLGPVSIGLNLLYRSIRDGPDETVASAFARFRLSRDVSIQAYGRHVVAGRSNTILGATLVLALGPRHSASAVFEHDRGGGHAAASYQLDPPAGEGGGYRLAASYGRSDSIEAAYTRHLPIATINAQASYANGEAGARLSASGSVGLIGKTVFASRRLGESFAQIRLDGYPGVRVYADNQLVGVTDRKGTLIVPGLRSYDRNAIRIDDADLPLEASLTANELEVRPFARSGTVVRFPVRRERGVLMRVVREDGSFLPAGAMVRAGAGEEAYFVASGGEVYVPDLTGRESLRAEWEGGACAFDVLVPDNDDPQPLLDNLVCRTPAYAAN